MYIRFTMKSKQLMRATDVHVFLPFHDGYPDATMPFKTMYFLPGYSANGTELAFALPMRKMCAQHKIAIVIPDGENAFYTDHPERATNNGSFVGEELVVATRRILPCLSKKREETYIGGISMGGYGALVLGLHYAHTFSKIAMMSPAVEVDKLLSSTQHIEGAPPITLFKEILGGREGYDTPRHNPLMAIQAKLNKNEKLPPIWMCCGKDDELVGDTCNYLHEFLIKKGVDCQFVGGDGGHDLPYLDAHLSEAFSFLNT